MKLTDKRQPRFTTPTMLDSETLVLGVPIKEWDRYLTGEIAETLAQLKEQVYIKPDAD